MGELFLAQAAEAAGTGGGILFSFILPMGAIFVIFYFLLIRPQQKQQKELEKKISSLKKGDRVVFGGGIYGEYLGDKEDSKIAVVKIGDDTKIEVIKRTIAAVVPKGEAATGEEVQEGK